MKIIPAYLSAGFSPHAIKVTCSLALLLGALAPVGSASALRQPVAPEWRDTGVNLENYSALCFDLTRPNGLLLSGNDGNTSTLNLDNGQIAPASSNSRAGCSVSGYLYGQDPDTGKAIRYSDKEPQGKPLDYGPVHFSENDSLQLYALAGEQVMYSADAGDTWQARPQHLPGPAAIAVSAADPSALYAATVEPGNTTQYSIYFSSDAGVTWERRSTGALPLGGPGNGNPITLHTLEGTSAPSGVVEMVLDEGIMGSSNKWHVYVSGDGGRTFNEVGLRSLGRDTRMVHTHQGILRLATVDDNASATYRLTLSTDGGKNWQELPSPWPSDYPSISAGSVSLEVVPTAPANVFIKDQFSLWYSPDGGSSWQRFNAEGYNTYVSPYLPITVVAEEFNNQDRLYALNLPAGGKHLTAPLPAEATSTNMISYFQATGHSLSGVFKQFWESHGGLPQFGYPRTEPFLERSDLNGKVYMVQYFERNRFEHHPEYRGTSSEVLLGLLGLDLTSEQRARGDGAFNRVEDPQVPGQIYFPETGHTLRNSFMRYWQANGGLAIYGFPISEEFNEVNPDNGQTYVVQYFERNRFEWHPENVNTPYEVLLGTLGNTLLKLKGYE